MLIIENHTTSVITVVGVRGVELDAVLQRKAGDVVDRRILQLNPGRYDFGTQEGGFGAEIVAGQIYSVAILKFPFTPKIAPAISPPPGCN